MPDRVIHCRDVSKCFRACRALAGVSFEVNSGDVFALIGPNGAGKTTIIRILLGIYFHDQGDVTVLGLNPATQFEGIGPRIGVVLERPGLSDRLTAMEYLNLYGSLYGQPAKQRTERIEAVLSSVGLLGRAHEPLGHLSKGMQQRVSLARCLLNTPELVILDEPFDGIDAESRCRLTEVLASLARESGTAVLITSHNLQEIEKLATTVAILKRGRILRQASVDSLCAPDPHDHTLRIVLKPVDPDREAEFADFLPGSRWNRQDRQLLVSMHMPSLTQDEILQWLLDRSFSVESMTMERKTLEDVYFELTREGNKQ